jgi:PST family polysaccharide transporter
VSELGRRTVAGVFWSAGSRIGQQGVQFAATVILARILGPTDFGLVAMIAVFSGFAVLLVDLGLAGALVQRPTIEERHRSSAFWLNVAAGLVLTGLMAACSPLIAALYGEPELLSLTLLLSVNFAIGSLTVVQTALLQRAMNFRRLAAIEVVAALVAGTAAVASAKAGLGASSLVVFTLVATGSRAAGLWLSTDWRPRFEVDRSAVRELWGFSGSLAGFSTVNYWARNADNLLVGAFVGANALGIYSRAYSTMLLPLNQVSTVVSRVMFPALSKIQDDPERVRRAYLRAVGIVALVTFPVATGLFVVSDPFIEALYGTKWAEAAPILQILCIAGLTQSVGSTVGWIYQSQGRTDWLLRWGIATSIVTIAAFAIGLHWGVRGVAIAYVVRTLLLTYFNFSIPGRLIGLRFADVVRTVAPVLAVSLAMGASVWAVGELVPDDWSAGSLLVAQVAAGVVLYVVFARAAGLRSYGDLRSAIREQRRPRHALGTA